MSISTPQRRWPVWLGLMGLLLLLVFWGYWSNRPFPHDGINWSRDYELSREQAYSTGRTVLLNFTADWCPPCRNMKRTTFPDPEIGTWINQNVLPVRVDLTQPGLMEMEMAQRWSAQAIPVLILVDGQGNEIVRKEGYQSPRELLAWLKTHASPAATTAPAPRPAL